MAEDDLPSRQGDNFHFDVRQVIPYADKKCHKKFIKVKQANPGAAEKLRLRATHCIRAESDYKLGL